MILSVDQLNGQLAKFLTEQLPDQVVVVTSMPVKIQCLSLLYNLETFDVIEIPDGEAGKSLETAEFIWASFHRLNITRKSVVIAVGGGSVLDIVGFAASTYMRGIQVVYIPTTLLAMVDSSEGGKTGLNFNGVKNLIGTFSQPTAILYSAEFLKSLPSIELLSGWAEIFKHGILEGHKIWELIQNGIPNIEDPIWETLIEENIRFKQSIVTADFKENGPRKLLNLGHTIGHALEALNYSNQEINHGICVANGMVIEAYIAHQLNLISPLAMKSIEDYCWKLFPKISVETTQIPLLLEIIKSDKKNNHHTLKFTLPQDIGKVNYDVAVKPEIIETILINWSQK